MFQTRFPTQVRTISVFQVLGYSQRYCIAIPASSIFFHVTFQASFICRLLFIWKKQFFFSCWQNGYRVYYQRILRLNWTHFLYMHPKGFCQTGNAWMGPLQIPELRPSLEWVCCLFLLVIRASGTFSPSRKLSTCRFQIYLKLAGHKFVNRKTVKFQPALSKLDSIPFKIQPKPIEALQQIRFSNKSLPLLVFMLEFTTAKYCSLSIDA